MELTAEEIVTLERAANLLTRIEKHLNRRLADLTNRDDGFVYLDIASPEHDGYRLAVHVSDELEDSARRDALNKIWNEVSRIVGESNRPPSAALEIP